MRASDLVLETASAFNANRARSFLTILGVVIGIAAVIAMTAMIGGIKSALVGELGLSQARLVSIYCDYGRPMNVSDVRDMATELGDYFDTLLPTTTASADVTSAKEKGNGYLQGVTHEYGDVMELKLVQGRFFNERESDSGALVAVIDEAGAKYLFGSESGQAVGKVVRIGDSEYEVVGVLESQNAGYDTSTVNAYIPFTTCCQRLTGSYDVGSVQGLSREDVDADKAADAAEKWLIARFRIPESEQETSMYVYTMKSIIDQLDTLIASFQLLMTVVASISLLVGGIGIMNMMLTNVTERIREIGLRKALGARQRDITRQFLLESICLTLIGGVVGILLGYGLAFVFSILGGSVFAATGFSGSITPTIGLDTVAMVAGICIFIGILFGYYPARRAAKLDPVESLHYQ